MEAISPRGADRRPPPLAEQARQTATKYCKFCGAVIDAECVVCPQCGKQVESLKQEAAPPPQVVINNSNNNVNLNKASATAAVVGPRRGRRRHGLLWWLCIGWWYWLCIGWWWEPLRCLLFGRREW